MDIPNLENKLTYVIKKYSIVIYRKPSTIHMKNKVSFYIESNVGITATKNMTHATLDLLVLNINRN